MKKNIALLNRTMVNIMANPETHAQDTWTDPCKSTKCYAGHAATLAGAGFDRKIWQEDEEWYVDCETGQHVPFHHERRQHIRFYAQKKLGLTGNEASYLFDAERTVDQLVEAVDKFSDGYTTAGWGFFRKENTDNTDW